MKILLKAGNQPDCSTVIVGVYKTRSFFFELFGRVWTMARQFPEQSQLCSVPLSSRSSMWRVLSVLACLTWVDCALARPWQDLVQPIGTMVITPPQSAIEVNRYLMSLDPNITPATFPFALSTDVTKIRTTQTQYFVRVYNPSTGSNPVGSWIVRVSQLRGLSRDQIRNVLALPSPPVSSTLVEVPAGIVMYTGLAGAIAGWGDGGATQSKMMGPPYVPVSQFMNQQPLTDCFYCYRTLATEGNANRVAVAMDANIPKAYSDLDRIYDNLDLLYFEPTAQAFRQSLTSLSGEAITASQTAAFQNNSLFLRTIAQKQVGWFAQRSSPDHDRARSASTLWAQLAANRSWIRADSTAADVGLKGASLTLGLERVLSSTSRIGVTMGVANTDIDVSSLESSGSQDVFGLALDAVQMFDAYYLAGALSYQFARTSLSRVVRVNQLVSQQSAQNPSNMLGARLETGYLHQVGSLTLNPFIAVEPARLWQAGTTERLENTQSGIDMGLVVKPQQTTSFPMVVGLRAMSTFTVSNRWVLKPDVGVSWIYEFSRDRQVNASLKLMPDTSFTVVGASAIQSAGLVSLGLSAAHASGVTTRVSGQAMFAGRGAALQFQAELHIPF